MPSKPKSKKRPAHEVILADLKKLDEEWLIRIDASRAGRHLDTTSIDACKKALASVLTRIYIPKSARAKVIEELRELWQEDFGPMSEDFTEIRSGYEMGEE